MNNDMVKQAISKMKSGKAAGPSGIVGMSTDDQGKSYTVFTLIHDLVTTIIHNGKIPIDGSSFLACLYKGYDDTLDESPSLQNRP